MLVKNSAFALQNLKSKANSFSSNSSAQQNSFQNSNFSNFEVKLTDTFSKTALTKNASIKNANFEGNKSAIKLHTVSFTGNSSKNPNQVALIGAEMPPYFKIGGVATVMNDYPNMLKGIKSINPEGIDAKVFIPYYNGKIEYDTNGNPTGKVSVLKKGDKPIITNADLTAIKVDDLKPDQYHELEEVASRKMKWGKEEEDVILYKKPNTEHYFVYTDITAKMPKPYETPASAYSSASSYSSYSSYSSGSKPSINGTQGDPYAKFNKAYTELVPALEKEGFNPAHHLLSDPPTAYVPEYMAQKAIAGDSYYKGTKASYVMHNVGSGYQGETSAQNMFHNFASKPQIETVEKDPIFIEALKNGETEKYYEKVIPTLIDEKGAINPSMIPIRHAQLGYVTRIDTVSEGYAEDAVKNPETAKGLTGHLKELESEKKFGGILNGFGDKSFDSSKPLGFKFYDTECTDAKTGITHKPYKQFHADMSMEEILQIKKDNTKSLMGRFVEGADPKYSLDVLVGRHKSITGHIDPKFINDDVNLFVSWGRGDKQKGLDIAINAFEKFAKTEKGKNAVLIVGGLLEEESPESTIIKKKMDFLITDPQIKGRIVYIDGFTPNKPLASPGLAAIFPSRFAPCELIDLEAMKYGCTPIVTNIQGMAQKNPDPRNPLEAEKATSYKTKNPFHSSHEKLIEASSQFKEGYDKLLDAEKKKLEIKGVTGENLEKVATKNIIEKNKTYALLFRKCADDILIDEFVEAMTAKVSESPETRARLIKNQFNAKTDWDNNHALHPNGKSSQQMYEELHIKGKSSSPKTSLFELSMESFNDFKTKTAQAVNQVKEKVENTIDTALKEEKAVNKSHGKIIAIAASAAALVGGAIYLFKKDKNNAALAPSVQNQLKTEVNQAPPSINQVNILDNSTKNVEFSKFINGVPK